MPKRSWSDAWNCRRVLFSEKNQVGGSLMIRSGMVHMRQQYRDIAFGGYKRHIMPFVNFLSLGSQMREGQLGVFAEICMFIRRNTETVLYLFLLLGDHLSFSFWASSAIFAESDSCSICLTIFSHACTDIKASFRQGVRSTSLIPFRTLAVRAKMRQKKMPPAMREGRESAAQNRILIFRHTF